MPDDNAIDITAITARIVKDVNDTLETTLKSFRENYATKEFVSDLREKTAELKNAVEEFAGMTEGLVEKINQCIDEIRTVGGKKIRDVDPEPIKKARKRLTLLDLASKK